MPVPQLVSQEYTKRLTWWLLGQYCSGRRLVAVQVLEGDSLPFSSNCLYGKNHTITASSNMKICIMHLFQFSSSGPWVTQEVEALLWCFFFFFFFFFFRLLFMNELNLIPIMVLRELILPSLRSKWSRSCKKDDIFALRGTCHSQ